MTASVAESNAIILFLFCPSRHARRLCEEVLVVGHQVGVGLEVVAGLGFEPV